MNQCYRFASEILRRMTLVHGDRSNLKISADFGGTWGESSRSAVQRALGILELPLVRGFSFRGVQVLRGLQVLRGVRRVQPALGLRDVCTCLASTPLRLAGGPRASLRQSSIFPA